MSNTPDNMRFSKSHEWALDHGDGSVTVGITDHAQELLGDMVFVELPEVGARVEAGSEFSLVESVKAASDVYSPVTGEVIEVNEALADAPETINAAAYTDGWIARIRLDGDGGLGELLDSAGYEALLAAGD